MVRVAKCHKLLYAYVKMIYDYFGDQYDFTFDALMNNYPTCDEANEFMGKLYHTFGMKLIMGEPAPPLYSNEEIEERAQLEEPNMSYPQLKPKEYREYIPKERRMPFRMMADYINRKKKATKPKPKRKVCRCKK